MGESCKSVIRLQILTYLCNQACGLHMDELSLCIVCVYVNKYFSVDFLIRSELIVFELCEVVPSIAHDS